MNAIARLAHAIGYPEEIPAGVAAHVLTVEGRPVEAREEGDRLVLVSTLAEEPDEALLVRFAGYAAGRLLKEEAVLAWDPRTSSLILWQGVPATSSDDVLRRFLEVFATSCEWWLARLREEESATQIPEMVIRP